MGQVVLEVQKTSLHGNGHFVCLNFRLEAWVPGVGQEQATVLSLLAQPI
jgi:hypothetical protein